MLPRARTGRPWRGRRGPEVEQENNREIERGAAPPAPPPLERKIEELFLRQNSPIFNVVGDPVETEI